jgi:hypothetical protein
LCLKKKITSKPVGRHASARTPRLRFGLEQPNRVTRTGVAGVGASHLSINKRKDI